MFNIIVFNDLVKYKVIRVHISRKKVDSGLSAIAPIAALRRCMADLKNAAKVGSKDWFLMVRGMVDDEPVQAGFARLSKM